MQSRTSNIAYNYPPFGSSMAGRNFSNSSYKYGFNNQEQDKELGEYYAFEYRIHDARLGRFLSIDPLAKDYPYYSTYQFAGNRLIDCIDLEGAEPKSIVKQTSHEETIFIPDDLPGQSQRIKVQVIDYKFTAAAVHILSLVSGVSAK